MKYLDGGQLSSYSELKEYSHSSPAASVFVGLATMVVLFPIPGYIAKKVQNVQVQRMKKVLSHLVFLSYLTFL